METIHHWEKSNHTRDMIFLPRFTCLPTRLSPLCQPTLGGLVAKRCCMNLIHTIGHRTNLPTSEVTQLHKQSTRVNFRPSTGEGTRPLTIPRASHEQSPTHAKAPLLLQAIKVVSNTKSNKKFIATMIPKCH
jgi:hypothetical protein